MIITQRILKYPISLRTIIIVLTVVITKNGNNKKKKNDDCDVSADADCDNHDNKKT